MVPYCTQTWTNQIKDPLAAELQDLAEEAIDGVDHGAAPKPEKYLELVFGPEIVELDGFVEEIKVRRVVVLRGVAPYRHHATLPWCIFAVRLGSFVATTNSSKNRESSGASCTQTGG